MFSVKIDLNYLICSPVLRLVEEILGFVKYCKLCKVLAEAGAGLPSNSWAVVVLFLHLNYMHTQYTEPRRG